MYNKEKQIVLSFLKNITTRTKLCFILIGLFTLVSTPSQVNAQSKLIDLNLKDVTISEAVKAVEKQSNYKFVYNNGDVDSSKKISINAAKQSIESVAKMIFAGYDVSIKGNNVIIAIRKSATATSNVKPQQTSQRNVTGQVLDEKTNETIIGASVRVVNGDRGVATDIDGKFSIPVSGNNTILLISYIGYDDERVEVGVRSELGEITMTPSSKTLDEVVVTAFGAGQKKASLVGSIQTIRPSDLRVPSSNLSTSFAGRMAGVIAFQRSGQPGKDGAEFYIRGISTISGARSPLIVLDGVEISAGDLNALDPEVIDGFSILKDASATALYGSRGANGVMIVTTKSGRNLDKPVIKFRLEANMAQPTYMPKFVNGPTYMRLYNEAQSNLSGSGVPFTQEQITGVEQNLNPYVFPNVNWYDEMFNNQAYNQKFNFNITGGGKKIDYFMNVTVNHETGLLKGRSKEFFSFDNNINIIRYAFQNNINVNLGSTSKVALRLNAQMADKKGPNFDDVNTIFSYVVQANPVDFPVMYEPDGISQYVRWGGKKIGAVNAFNPVANLVSGYRNTFESTLIANLEFDQKLDFILEGLRFNALASFKNWSTSSAYRQAPSNIFQLQSYNKDTNGKYIYDVALTGTEQTVVLKTTSGTSGDRRIYMQGMLDYKKTFNDVHDLNVMLVYNQDEYNLNNAYSDDGYTLLINTLPKRRQSMAARVTYAYASRYLLDINAGYNGSENFAKGKRFGIFPSVALGYNIAEENFFAPLRKTIQQFKIRGSWGLVGNDQIGGARFIYMPQISLQEQGFTTGINMDEKYSGPKYKRYANYNLTWEVGEKLNLGVDVKMFKDLSFSVDFFREHRRNIFQERGTLPTYLGTGDTKVYGNTAEVMNKGIDLFVDYQKQVNKDLSVFMKGTFTYAHNKILKFDEPLDQMYPNLMNVGRSLNMNFGYVAEGLFIDKNDIINHPEQKITVNVAPGDIRYKNFSDKNGNFDNQIDNNDQVALGYPTVPEIIYGFGPNILYKNFDFGIYFQGAARTSLMMSGFHPFGRNYNANVAQWIADSHWSPANQDLHAAYPRLTQSEHPNNTVNSTYWLRDGSFLKLKNAEMGYRFKNMRIYVSATNLLTFSKFKLWDPERGGGSGMGYPTQRVINVGFNMNINQ